MIGKYALDFEINHKARADINAPKIIRSAVDKQNIRIAWESVETADGYAIYRKSNGQWKQIAYVNATTTAYTDKKLKASTKYTYTVVPYRIVDGVRQYGKFDMLGISKTTGGK